MITISADEVNEARRWNWRNQAWIDRHITYDMVRDGALLPTTYKPTKPDDFFRWYTVLDARRTNIESYKFRQRGMVI